MINLIPVTCPNCSASLQIEENRKEAFCTYCGTKILIHNENEKIIHTIDDAAIARANADKEVELRKIESEENYRNQVSKEVSVFNIAFFVFLIIFVVAISISEM